MKVPLLRKKLIEDFRTLETMQKSVNKLGILCSWCLWRKHGFVCHCQIYQKWFWEKEMDYSLEHFAESEWDGKLLKHKSRSGSENPKSSQFPLFFRMINKVKKSWPVIQMDWRQFGFKTVAILRMLRYKFGGSIITFNHFDFALNCMQLYEWFVVLKK